MKFLRLLFTFTLAVLATALTLGILFFLIPAWQESALRSLLAKDPDNRWQVDSFRLQPGGVQAGGVFLLRSSLAASVDRADLRGPLWKTPLSRNLSITSGEVEGLTVDLTKLPMHELALGGWFNLFRSAEEQARFYESKIAEVLIYLHHTPVAVKLKNVRLRGQILLPGGVSRELDWQIRRLDTRPGGGVELAIPAAAER